MNLSLELYLIKALFSYTIYIQYSSYIREDFIKDNNKDLYKILQVIHLFHKAYPTKNISSIEEFLAYYNVNYPSLNKDKNIEFIVERLFKVEVKEEIAEEIFQRHFEQTTATELSILSLEVAEGKKTFEELRTRTRELEQLRSLKPAKDIFISDDLSELEGTALGDGGLNWRLAALNQSLGPLRKGDFGFLFARPETGKTTFLASEMTHFLGQTKGNIIWFNNEEEGAKVKLRCLQAYFGVKLNELLRNKEKYQKRYLEETSGRFKVVRNGEFNTRRSIDDLCARLAPSVIIFDQIDKIGGFADDRNDLELTKIYQWARDLAKQYGAVIGVCQARVTGENKEYLTMDDVANSQTGKQGEADWMLGIGKKHQPGLEHIRFFNICKNKLMGGKLTNESQRHGKFQVRIWPEVARYEDIQ
jgi:replicative DNA helicase